MTAGKESGEAIDYFSGAPGDVINFAANETLKYLQGDAGGEVKPQIPAAFLGTPRKCYLLDAIRELFENAIF